MPSERFMLYGLIPKDREHNEPMEFDEQNVGDKGQTLIYATDNAEEARAIYEAGGFERGGVWCVVTRVEDQLKQRPVTNRPAVPSKRNYDQS